MLEGCVSNVEDKDIPYTRDVTVEAGWGGQGDGKVESDRQVILGEVGGFCELM